MIDFESKPASPISIKPGSRTSIRVLSVRAMYQLHGYLSTAAIPPKLLAKVEPSSESREMRDTLADVLNASH